MSNAYEQAGVSIENGDKVIGDLKSKIDHKDCHVLGGIGSFAGCYQLSDDQLDAPVLVAGSDGVGTKVLLAAEANQVSTIGQDLVAMCVNDLLAQGALPLFFLDYLAVSHLEPQTVEQILAGVLVACQNNCINLLGGETAEMPGVYQNNHFDLAGFAVGLVQRQQMFKPEDLKDGDCLIGLPSSGLHSNGYSLVRKILFEDHDFNFNDVLPALNRSLINELLEPTEIYTQLVRPLFEQQLIAGVAHITGGGLLDNVPRMLPEDLQAEIDVSSWPTQPIFTVLTELGNLTAADQYQTFNMGIGMVLVVHKENRPMVLNVLKENNTDYYEIGQLRKKDRSEAPVQLLGVNPDD